jgi:HemK-related putative methylase
MITWGRMLARSVRGAAARVDLLRYRARARWKTSAIERVGELELWVPPTVLSAADFRTGPLLAEVVAAQTSGERVLDMGSGTGIVAIRAALSGKHAVAIDKNPAAVRATRVNAMINGADVDAREGDLFAPLSAEERFHTVAFNPPFFTRPVDGELADALFGGTGLEVLDRFLRDVRRHLVPGGRVFLAGSTNGALARMRELYRVHDFAWRTVRTKERIAERLVIDLLS